MRRTTYIGIDPGAKGGYGIIGESVEAYPWDAVDFAACMSQMEAPCMACVEKVGAMPGQGVTSMFQFGKNAGMIEGVLIAFKIPYQLVSPSKWKAEFGLLGSKKNGVVKTKQDSIDVCKKMFPGVDLRRTSACRTDSDGMAEALLMAEYARRKL